MYEEVQTAHSVIHTKQYHKAKNCTHSTDTEGDNSQATSQSSMSDEEDLHATIALIEKPVEEVGRLGRGGYSLEKELEKYGWD